MPANIRQIMRSPGIATAAVAGPAACPAEASRFVPEPSSAPGYVGPIAVWLLDEPECRPYADYVQSHPDATCYHTPAWRDALIAAGVGRAFYLLAMDGDGVVGALPLLEVEDGGPQLISLPSTPAAGVLADDRLVRSLLLSRALRLAHGHGAAGVELRGYREADETSLTAPASLRVSIAQLLLLPPPAGTEEPELRSLTASREIVALLRAAAPRTALLGLLPHLLRTPLRLECVVAPGPSGEVAAAAVWTRQGCQAHLLACGPAPLGLAQHGALIHAVAEVAGREGAAALDFAFPEAPDAWFDRVAALDDTQVAVSTILDREGLTVA